MARRISFVWPAIILLGLVCAHAQEVEDLEKLQQQVRRAYNEAKYVDALSLVERYVGITRQRLGEAHPLYASAIEAKGDVLVGLGRYTEAEPLYKNALSIWDQEGQSDSLSVGRTLSSLAWLYERQGRYAEGEGLFRRALSIYEKVNGPDHPDVAAALNNLAFLLRAAGRYTDAEPLFKRALAIGEKTLRSDSPSLATTLDNLAVLYRAQGRYAEAEPLHKRALDIREKALGPGHPSVAGSLANLGALYKVQGRYAEAEPLYLRALSIREKTRGPNHPDVAKSQNNLALLYFAQRDWVRAAEFWQRSADLTIQRTQRGTDDVGQSLTGRRKDDAEQVNDRFQNLVKASYRIALQNAGLAPNLAKQMFEMAQWAKSSEAATSLAQMAARGAHGDATLSQLARERQDLVAEWQRLDSARDAALSAPESKRDRAAETANDARLDAIDARIADIDRRLAIEFPDYAALTRRQSVSVAEIQAQLRADEALVLFLDTPRWRPTSEETFIWVVTQTEIRWVRSSLGTTALAREVAALRCGLDSASWDIGHGAKCKGLLNSEALALDAPLPFDIARAHALYKALFGQIEEAIKGKHLLIVPSGALTALPFQVLVTAPVATDRSLQVPAGYGSAAWIINDHAITVLPTAASLKSLRQLAKASKASRPFVGFGNPLLVGPSGDDKRAWTRQSCPQAKAAPIHVASRGLRGDTSRIMRGGLADVERIRNQAPLPETADELCAVALSTGAPEGAVYLGDRATESTIKALSADGTLAQARVVHFATHGLLAGESSWVLTTKSEPALILTPPKLPTEEDDGLLTTSEVARLKLDADWVVLSACNTAAGENGDADAETLSGLARAFFYAGARALLVSHWAVDSDATVKLVTKAFDEINANGQIGRAEALRRSMIVLIGSGGRMTHPSNWAPFVVVGEGAGPR